MNLLERMSSRGHEQVIAFRDHPSGLLGYLGIHSTRRGPALGGVRLMRYARERDALEDVLRLSRSMSYKCALAGLPAGGGKAVILEHPGLRRAEAFEAFGRLVESLGGRFFTGGDIGIRPEDLAAVRKATTRVACESSPELGDINEHTAMGVWHAMRACLEVAGPGASKVRVAIQGVGNVGGWLARITAREGLDVVVADVEAALARRVAKETRARLVTPGRILSTPCDVFAPCALGGILNAASIPRLRARIVCGGANNQLATARDGERLARRGILYAPDYLANAGGVIRGAEFYLMKRAESWSSLERIHGRMLRVARIAEERRVSTARVADELAEAALAAPPQGRRPPTEPSTKPLARGPART